MSVKVKKLDIRITKFNKLGQDNGKVMLPPIIEINDCEYRLLQVVETLDHALSGVRMRYSIRYVSKLSSDYGN